MATISNTAEGGTNGTVATTANSGGASGDAFSAAGGGTDPVFSTAAAMRGTLGYSFTYPSTSAAGYVAWSNPQAGRVACRFYIQISALPSGNEQIGAIRAAAAGAICNLRIASSGLIGIQNAASVLISGSSAPATFPVGVPVRFEVAVTPGTTTSNGRVEYAYYLGNSATAEFSYDSGTTQNMGTANFAELWTGRWTAATAARAVYLDAIQVQDLASGFIGPPTTAGNVTAVAGTASATSPAPVVVAGVSGVVAAPAGTAVASMVSPTVQGLVASSVVGVAATASSSMVAPVVTGLQVATVVAVPATATSAVAPPAIVGLSAATVFAVPATATSSAVPPGVAALRAAVVLAVVGTSSGTLPAPTVSAGAFIPATVMAAVLSATSVLLSPGVIAQRVAAVAAVTMTALTGMVVPSITAQRTASVTAIRAQASAAVAAPSVVGGTAAAVASPVATATVTAPQPMVMALRNAVVSPATLTAVVTAWAPEVVGQIAVEVEAPPAAATALLSPSFIRGDISVGAVPFVATATLLAPAMDSGPPPPITSGDLRASFVDRGARIRARITLRQWTGLL